MSEKYFEKRLKGDAYSLSKKNIVERFNLKEFISKNKPIYELYQNKFGLDGVFKQINK
jgi:hypothetical protein